MAEFWALRDGLMLCNQMNLSDVIVELDAKALVDAFRNPSYANSVIFPLFEDCKQLASRIPHLYIRHIYCEANKCVDKLASIGLNFVIYSCLPVDLFGCFEADYLGLYFNRLCPDTLVSLQFCVLMIFQFTQKKKKRKRKRRGHPHLSTN